MEPPVQHNGKKYLFGNQSPLLPVFLLQHEPPRAFGDLRWLPVPLASFPGEERALVVWLWCSGAGTELLLLLLNLGALLGGSAGRLAPSNSVRASTSDECSFQWIIFHSDPFFFPGVLTDLWTRQYPLFAVLRCQMPQSVYIAGVYSFEIKSVGQWELEMLFWRQRGSSEGKGDAATPFFQIYFTTS